MIPRFVLTLTIVVTIGCSYPATPSAPGRVVMSRTGEVSSLSQQTHNTICDAYGGEAQGLCHALLAMDCDSAEGGKGEACDRLIREFRDVTGELPPFLNRFYVARDPAVCQAILFVCEQGLEAFYDASGCGCQRVAP